MEEEAVKIGEECFQNVEAEWVDLRRSRELVWAFSN